MTTQAHERRFSIRDIDLVRESTGDSNLVHDEHRWHEVFGNPFKGPIALGFQLVDLIDQSISEHRRSNSEDEFAVRNGLSFSHYEINFMQPVHPGESLSVVVKDTKHSEGTCQYLSNRVVLRASGGIAVVGFKKEASEPLFLNDQDFDETLDVDATPNGSYLKCCDYYLVRNRIDLSQAKRYRKGCLGRASRTPNTDEPDLSASGAQAYPLPELFPVALVSAALKLKAKDDGWSIESVPLVYCSHRICIDRHRVGEVVDGMEITLLIAQKFKHPGDGDSLGVGSVCDSFVYGLLPDRSILFRAQLTVSALAAPAHNIVASQAINDSAFRRGPNA